MKINSKLLLTLGFLYIFLLLPTPALAQTNYDLTPAVIIDFFGIIIGLISIFLIFSITRKLSGIIGKTFYIFLYGIISMVIALVYTLIFARFKIYPIPAGVDIHHILMFIGLILFVLGAHKLAKINQVTKSK